MRSRSVLLVVATLVVAGGCSRAREAARKDDAAPAVPGAAPAPAAAPPEEDATGFNPRLLRRFQPIGPRFDGPSDDAVVELGKTLWFDGRLSQDGTVACNTCHPLDHGGADGLRLSPGVGGRKGRRNTPTALNAAGAFAQFWDGRAATLEEQARGPLFAPVEMAAEAATVESRLRAVPGYPPLFARAFPGDAKPVTVDHVVTAIAAFERRLATPGRWDRFLQGDHDALNAREREGLKVFTNVGCMVCHTGALLGGTSYQKAGAVEPWPSTTDLGRFDVTKNPADKYVFKVPTLRNVARTAPYFHDGSAATLPDAIRMMGRHQLGLELSEDEVGAIGAWLGALSGDLPADLVTPLRLP